MATKINEADLWAEKFDSLFNSVIDNKYLEYILPGGRHSTKSSVIAEFIIFLMQTNPHVSTLVIRKTANTLRRSVFEKIKWSMKQWHVTNRYKIPKSEIAALPMTDKRTNQQIIYAGADDPEKIKSIALSDSYIGIVWFEEMTELSEAEYKSILVSALRDGENYGGKYWVFGSYNPPSSPRHWINNEMRKPRADRIVFPSSYLDIPRKWISAAVMAEIEHTRKTNERAYKNIYLGEATGSGSLIFENVELRKITNEEIHGFNFHYFGLDFGYYPDPLLYNAFSYDMPTKTLYIYDELKLLKHGNYEASEKLKEHLQKFYTSLGMPDFNFMGDRITADSAEPKSVNDFRSYGWNMRGAIKGRGSLETGVKWLQTRTKIVIDPERCPEAADEFSLFEYDTDKRTGEILTGVPQGQPDHSIAAIRYGSEELWRGRGV